MKHIYPAIFTPDDIGGYCITFPDIKMGGTQGEDLIDGMEMAEDFLCLALYHMEEENMNIPEPSDARLLKVAPDDIVTLVTIDTDNYRRFYDNKLVKKTLNIPSWLNSKAEAASINFSKILQKALKEELHIVE